MTMEEIKTLVTAIIASLGGITGIVAIINGIVRVFAAAKQAKATRGNTSALGEIKDELLREIDNRLACSLDVDISAKLNPIFEALEKKYINTAECQTEQMYALKQLMIEVAQMMSSSRKLSEDDKLRLIETIAKCNELVQIKAAEEKPKLKLTLPSETQTEVKAAETKHKVVV